MSLYRSTPRGIDPALLQPVTKSVLLASSLFFASGAAVALPSANSSSSDRACIEQLNAVSERIYQQQQSLVQVKAQIGDEAINGDESVEQRAQSRVAAVDSEINRRERAQRSIGVVAQLVYGQRAGIAGMTYSQALKYAQHHMTAEYAQLHSLSLSQIEQTGKSLRARYGNCSTRIPSFGTFAETIAKERKKVNR